MCVSGMTYKKGVNTSGDDDMTVLLQIQMADAEDGDDGTSHTLSIGLHMGDVVAMLRKDIEVTRDFTEVPDILLEAELVNGTEIWEIR